MGQEFKSPLTATLTTNRIAQRSSVKYMSSQPIRLLARSNHRKQICFQNGQDICEGLSLNYLSFVFKRRGILIAIYQHLEEVSVQTWQEGF